MGRMPTRSPRAARVVRAVRIVSNGGYNCIGRETTITSGAVRVVRSGG